MKDVKEDTEDLKEDAKKDTVPEKDAIVKDAVVEDAVVEDAVVVDASEEHTLDPDEPIVIKPKETLPAYSKTYLYVPISAALTLVSIILGHLPFSANGLPKEAWQRYTYIVFGVILIFLGLKLIMDAVSNANIRHEVRMGHLVREGIYKYIRNPEYAGVLYICTGLLFISGNTFFYTTAIVLWIFLILLMKYTEEVWLHKMFGIRYDRYKNATNAWFPIKPSNYISDDE